MRSILLCLLGVILAVGVHSAIPDVQLDDIPEFSSPFLEKEENAAGLLDLMKAHFNNSLDYLHSGKYFESQNVDYPGMAKLLVGESDRHWEEGMSVLKKYLHLGGTTNNGFTACMDFSRTKADEPRDAVDVQYKRSLITVMDKSQRLNREITKLHSDANKAPNRSSSRKGDAALLHFLEEKAENENDVARKMAGLYVTVRKMHHDGVALGIFDQSL